MSNHILVIDRWNKGFLVVNSIQQYIQLSSVINELLSDMILSNIHVWSTDRFEVYKSPFMISQRETELSNFWYPQETSQIQHEKLDLLGIFF